MMLPYQKQPSHAIVSQLIGLLLVLTAARAASANREVDGLKVPSIFTDLILPYGNRNGQDFGPLGHILKLDTLLAPKRAESIETGFSIFNRKQVTENLVFKQGQKYCVDQANSTKQTCHGEFPIDVAALGKSQFNPKTRTIIMISGFMTNGYSNSWLERTKDLWLELEDVDVILVTWANANKYLYSRAVADTPLVARQITIFLHYLAEMSNSHLMDTVLVDNIHFIGHSLGAHIAAYTGQDLGGRMGRITGLDPAGPSYDQMPKERRLDPSDAQLVDVIHTNSGKLRYANLFFSAGLRAVDLLMSRIPYVTSIADRINDHYTGEGDTAWFGIDANVGHLDYYVNGGRVQPGCNDIMHMCDHGRSTRVYESILRHQVALANMTRVDRQRNRLLAFVANDYASFVSGANFDALCPSLLRQSQVGQDSLLRCSVPIDLITPASEFKYELVTKYGLNLNPTRGRLGRKYFFKTMSTQPFVGDHYLLKMHLDPSSSWQDNCALQAAVSMNNEIGTSIDINRELRVINNLDFYGLAIPFVNPFGVDAHNALYEMLRNSSNSTRLALSMNENLAKVLPSHVNLSIRNARSTSLLETARNSMMRFFTLGRSHRLSQSCSLVVMSIEIEPITGSTSRLSSIYKLADSSIKPQRSADSANSSESQNPPPVLKPKLLSRKEHSQKLRQARNFAPLLQLAGSGQEEACVQLDTFSVFGK